MVSTLSISIVYLRFKLLCLLLHYRYFTPGGFVADLTDWKTNSPLTNAFEGALNFSVIDFAKYVHLHVN